MEFPWWHKGRLLPQQPQLRSDPWPGISICCRTTKKEKEKRGGDFYFSFHKLLNLMFTMNDFVKIEMR